MLNYLKKWWSDQTVGEDAVNKKSVVIVMLLLLFAVIFAWISISSDVKDVRINSEKAEIITNEWQVTCQGKTNELVLPAVIDASAGDVVEMSMVLDEEKVLGNSIFFYSRQSWAQIYLDGELMEASDKSRKIPFAMTPGSGWVFLRLPADYDGKTLKIELEMTIDKYAKELPTVYMGTKASFIYMVLEQGRSSLLLVIPVLFLGVGLCGIGIFIDYPIMRRRFCRLGLFAVITSVWSLLESRITQLLFGNMVLASYVLFSCFYLIPVLATGFLLTFETLRKRKYMKAMFWLSAAVFVVAQLLQITGVCYYIQLVSVVHILIGLIILGVALSYIDLCKKKETIPDKSIYRAMMILGLFCCLDILSYYMNPTAVVGSFSKIGMLLFFAYLAHTGIRQLCNVERQEAENRIYHKLAYSDIMTNLSNRTAFERDLDAYRREPWEEETILLIADMNGLKYINDHYGHAHGDRALIQLAELIRQCFGESCKCYRIGGDEFSVISRGIPEEQFVGMCEQLKNSVAKQRSEEGWELSVSCGYYVVDGSGIDESYKEADARMYAEKAAYKKKREQYDTRNT